MRAGSARVIVPALVLAALAGAILAGRAMRPPGAAAREAEARISRGEALERESRFDAAGEEYEEALSAARDLADPRLVAISANRLADLRLRAGETEPALSLAREALEAARSAGSAGDQSDAFFNLGYTQYSLGALRYALRSFESSASAASSASDSAREAKARLHIGITAAMMEESGRAREALEEAARLSFERGDARGQAEAIRVLGQLHTRLGETQSALERFTEARRLLEPLGDPATEATILNALGEVHFDMGDFDAALLHYRQALDRNRRLKLRRREAATLLELGRCLLELGRAREALEPFEQALAIYRELENARLEADVLVELGRLRRRLGENETALEDFERALDLKLGADDPRGRAYTLNEAGDLRRTLGDREAALASFREAAEIGRGLDDPLGESLARYHEARSLRDAGRLQDARAAIERSLELVETLRARVASFDLRTSFFATVHERYAFYIDLLLRLHSASPGGGFDGLAFQAAERARARTLLESLEEAAASIREGIDPELLAEERRLRELLNQAAREQALLPPRSDPELRARLANEIAALAFEHDRLQATLRARSPRYAALTRPDAATLASVRSTLDGETRLLAYSLSTEKSFLFSVSRNGHSIHELPGREEIERLAREAHRFLRSPRSRGESPAVARLAEILIGPIEGLEGSRRLLVVSEGAMGYVPFSVLPTPGGGSLIDSFEIVRLPSASIVPVLRAQRRGRRFDQWALVAADPVYGDDALPSLGLGRLRESRAEALAIQALAPAGAVEVVTGSAASRDWIERADFSGFRAVHFATHAVVDDEHPELSGIVLSLFDENGLPRDGFLRLHDVYNLSLPVDLVVLSACETALGKDVRGEGLLGLVRGFMYAGAAAVVASTWKVDDRATRELMERFYRGYFEGKSPAAALREAQISLRDTARFRAPYYWAGFELQGDWRE
jgi:CHAT domain-containing protein/Tfp pilus assembly protein PilF